MIQEAQKLSTSALARLLDIPLPQLFNTLKDYGWIRKAEDGWLLTAKGEYEGGEYTQSKKYGRYIVWPEAIVEHPLIRAISEHRMLTFGAIGKRFNLSAREVACILAEQGLIQAKGVGWALTHKGRQLGLVLTDSEEYGQSYILCPHDLVDHDAITKPLQYLASLDSEIHRSLSNNAAFTQSFHSLDGHQHVSPYHQRVDDWLYLSGLVHATQFKKIEIFYLPSEQILIDVWTKESAVLAEHLKLEAESDLRVIQILPEHFAHLDTYLRRRFHAFGVELL